jgi:hypothetical protein
MSVNFNNKKKTDYSQLRHQAMQHTQAVNAAPVEVTGVPTADADLAPVAPIENGKMELDEETSGEVDGDHFEEENDEGPDSHEE